MTTSDKSMAGDSEVDSSTGSNGFTPKPTRIPEPNLTPEQIALIIEAEQKFDEMCLERHKSGKQKYGVFTFLEMPTLQMAMEEVADMANYARYTFIKLVLLQASIKQLQDNSVTSVPGFHSIEEVIGLRKDV